MSTRRSISLLGSIPLLFALSGCASDPITAFEMAANSVMEALSRPQDVAEAEAAATTDPNAEIVVVESPSREEVTAEFPLHTASQRTSHEPEYIELPRGPQAVADTDGPYLLDSGDKLRVFIYGQPNLSRGYTVDHDGNITVPLIGTVKARGNTTQHLEHIIRRELAAEFVRDPQVTVDILQNRPFFILGEVKNAGQYPYVSGMTVETAIAIAGGYTERASTRRYRVSRRINGFVEVVEAPADYVVYPGDTVYVYERFF